MLCNLSCLKARLRLLCDKLSIAQQPEPRLKTVLKVMYHLYFPNGVFKNESKESYRNVTSVNRECRVHIWTGGSMFVPSELEVQSRRICSSEILTVIKTGRQTRCTLGSLLFMLSLKILNG